MTGHKPPSTEIHLIVKGAVQGVFFRAATKRHADNLGIKGYVRNSSNGTVEICITSGDATQLIALLKEEPLPLLIIHAPRPSEILLIVWRCGHRFLPLQKVRVVTTAIEFLSSDDHAHVVEVD